MASKNLPRCC